MDALLTALTCARTFNLKTAKMVTFFTGMEKMAKTENLSLKTHVVDTEAVRVETGRSWVATVETVVMATLAALAVTVGTAGQAVAMVAMVAIAIQG